jgi:uncharacterized OB-fold protein
MLEYADGAPRLVGGRCADCDAVMFPLRARCPACASGDVRRELLPRRGTLWTWTVQGFAPKSPPYLAEDEFEPFGVGYVELDGCLRVEARLTESDPARLRIGMPMELVVLEREGRELYAFAPEAE